MSRHVLVSTVAALAAFGAVLATAPAASAAPASTAGPSTLALDPDFAPALLDTYFGAPPQVNRTYVAEDGSMVVAGRFNEVDGLARTAVARLLADGTVDPTFATVGEGLVPPAADSMVVQPDGKVVLGSMYDTYDGQPVNNVVRLNADGSLDTTFTSPDLPGRANGLGLQPDGKIIVGLSSGGPVRLNADGTLDDTWSTTMTPQTGVNSIAVLPDGDVMIGGAWDFLNGEEWRFGLARLNADGSTDFSFDPRHYVTNGFLMDLHVTKKGKVVGGGQFFVEGARTYLASFSKKGVLKDGFGTAASPSGAVISLDKRGKGKYVIGGLFTSVAGEPRGRVALINKDGTLNANTFDEGADDGQVWSVDSAKGGSVLIGGTFTSVNDSARAGLARFTR